MPKLEQIRQLRKKFPTKTYSKSYSRGTDSYIQSDGEYSAYSVDEWLQELDQILANENTEVRK